MGLRLLGGVRDVADFFCNGEENLIFFLFDECCIMRGVTVEVWKQDVPDSVWAHKGCHDTQFVHGIDLGCHFVSVQFLLEHILPSLRIAASGWISIGQSVNETDGRTPLQQLGNIDLWPATIRSIPLNTILATQFLPLMAFVAIVAAFTLRRTGTSLPGALLCALVVTWYIVAGQATQAAF